VQQFELNVIFELDSQKKYVDLVSIYIQKCPNKQEFMNALCETFVRIDKIKFPLHTLS